MKPIQMYSNEVLLSETKHWIEKERNSTSQLLEHLAEIEARMLFAELGFSSLWTFCIQYLKLSEGSASRRISSMRLSRQVPDAKAAIEQGSLSLANASQLQSFFNDEKKNGRPLTSDQKSETVKKIEGLSQADCSRTLGEISPSFKEKKKEGLKPIAPNQNLLTVILSSEIAEKLKLLQGRLGHQLPAASYAEVIQFLIEDKLSQIEKKWAFKVSSPREEKLGTSQSKNPEAMGLKSKHSKPQNAKFRDPNSDHSKSKDSTARSSKSETSKSRDPNSKDSAHEDSTHEDSTPKNLKSENSLAENSKPLKENPVSSQARSPKPRESAKTPTEPTSTMELPRKRKAIPIATRRILWNRSKGQCEFIAQNGKRCSGKHALEIDHMQSFAQDGSDDLSNLRFVCQLHNKYLAVQTFSPEWMEQFLPRIKRM